MIFILQYWNSGKSNHFSINITEIQFKTDPIHGLTKVVVYFALRGLSPDTLVSRFIKKEHLP